MEIQLPADQHRFVDECVAKGRFKSPGEVVSASIRLLQDQELLLQAKVNALRAEIQHAVDQLDRGEGVDGEEFWAEFDEHVRGRMEGAA